MSNRNSINQIKNRVVHPKQHKGGVHDQLIDPVVKDNDNTSVNPSVNPSIEDNTPDNVEINVASIPIAKAKRGIRETHKTKAFYIRNDIAKLIDKDIKTSRRGVMTEIVNALFEEYYKSQGRLK